jgi:hypothetical protein
VHRLLLLLLLLLVLLVLLLLLLLIGESRAPTRSMVTFVRRVMPVRSSTGLCRVAAVPLLPLQAWM